MAAARYGCRMRLIAGSAGGIPLLTPKHDMRPTSDRVREAVFSILGTRVEGAQVADLFAGSGAYGLEALSRGAARAVFVEKNAAACEIIGRNARKARLHDRAAIRPADAFAWLKAERDAFDIIFADPPYRKSLEDDDLPARLLKAAALARRLSPGGVLVLETLAGTTLNLAGVWMRDDERVYGASRVSFLQPRPRREPEDTGDPGAGGPEVAA